MEKLPDTVMVGVAGLSNARTKMRISQASRRWSSVVDKGPARESCHMRIEEARCKFINAMWRRPVNIRQWLEEVRRHALEELLEGQSAMQVKRRAIGSMTEWVELDVAHRRCLFECIRVMILGCGDEEAQKQVDEFLDANVQMQFRIGWSLSYLLCDEETLVREEWMSEEESEQESNVEEALLEVLVNARL